MWTAEKKRIPHGPTAQHEIKHVSHSPDLCFSSSDHPHCFRRCPFTYAHILLKLYKSDSLSLLRIAASLHFTHLPPLSKSTVHTAGMLSEEDYNASDLVNGQ